NALQQTFKILINSFYGYLGTSFSNFADPAAAAEVTRRGREIVHGILDALRAQGCKPIELDTDGVYFVPPDGADGASLVERIDLPAGIVLETDAWYPAMFSYKAKNYALLEKSGRVVIKGSGLKSRGIEKILRDLLQEILTRLLTDRAEEVPQLYERYLEQLEGGNYDVRALCRTETLSETPEQYRERVRKKLRNVSAPYELALLSGRKYQPGDQISYYVCGDARHVRVAESCRLASEWDHDENVVYYQQKVREMVERFLPYLPESSRHLKRVQDSRAARQMELNLWS
ncbi:MAG: DNA polymerase domain-containing protein, partial [Candidatus Xenobia bacterium]